MPKVGMRMIKSSIAVLCCFLISFLRQNEGIVFYSCIAAVLCIQQDIQRSKKVGFERIKGTLVGGLFGMLVLLFERSIQLDMLAVRYVIISFMLIPVIYTTVLCKMPGASHLACVVFMSITISHATDINPYLFTFNRILDTLIGVLVALVINRIHLPHAYHKKTLFVVHLDQVLLFDNSISSYAVIKLRQLLEQDANIALATHRSPGSFLSLVKEIPFSLPVVSMNGAALYSIQKQEYTQCRFLHMEDLRTLQAIFKKYEVNVFTHSIVNQVLHVYYQPFQNPLEEEYYHKMRKTPYINYICHTLPEDIAALYLYIIERKDMVQSLLDDIKVKGIYDHLCIRIKDDVLHSQYAIMEIYDKKATKQDAIQSISKEYGFTHLYEFISDIKDHCETARKTYLCKEDAKLDTPFTYLHVNEKSVVHKMDRLFHSRLKKKQNKNK